MHIQSAVITDQECSFLVIAVPDMVLGNRSQAEQTLRFFQTRSFGLPIALVTRDGQGVPTAYYGRSDLATRLVQTPPSAMAWQNLPLR